MTYSKVIEMAGGTMIGRFVHFTIGGGMAELVEAEGAPARRTVALALNALPR